MDFFLTFHARLGEGLFLIYLIAMGVVLFLQSRGREVPGALVGAAHALLALQVAFGAILLTEDAGRVVWYHPVLGILAMLAVGLSPALSKRLGTGRGLAATFGIIAIIALAAMLAAQ